MARMVAECRNASFCCSQALRAGEFFGMVKVFKTRPLIAAGPGIREIDDVFETLISEKRVARLASANKAIMHLNATETSHGIPCTVTALSPSDKQILLSLAEIAALIPGVETKYRCTPQSPNHTTVVIWVQIGDIALLLGGDLEETGDSETGWSVIVASADRPNGSANVFKVPHHGSANGHNDDVWSKMLVRHPFAILAPFNRGTKLPSPCDVERITRLTDRAYSTASLAMQRSPRRLPRAVEHQLSAMGVQITRAEPRTGGVRLRNGGSDAPNDWKIQLWQDACPLSQVHSS
jgi:hypothetical protein